MPLKTVPLLNNVLIEVQREDEDVSRAEENESLKYGILRAYHMEPYHLTASAAIQFDNNYLAGKQSDLRDLVGKVVRWEEFAEGGQTFEEDGKTYALIPFWRLIGFEETN